jgi:hypothetical protein
LRFPKESENTDDMDIRYVKRPPIHEYLYAPDLGLFEGKNGPEHVVIGTRDDEPVRLLDGKPPTVDLVWLLEHRRDLFHEFAGLDYSSLVAFAGRYGFLGIPAKGHGDAEWIEVWREEIAAVRDVVRDWEYLMRFGRTHGYRREWARRVQETTPSEHELMFFLLPEMMISGQGLETFEVLSGRAATAARKRLRELRIRAVEACRKRVLERVDAKVAAYVKAALLANESDGFTLSWAPRTLIGVIWLQVARVVTGTVMARSCAYADCGVLLVDRRRHARFCSDNHRALESQRIAKERKAKRDQQRRAAA